MRISSLAAALTLLAVAATPVGVAAHTQLAASTPAQSSTVARPRTVTLTFAEAVSPTASAASIVMTAMPGVPNHGEMVIRNFTTVWSSDNKTMTLTLRQPLPVGSYDVRWQATGADGHRVTGTVSFTVN